MHQSIPAAPSPPPGATAGHLPAWSVLGVGHLQILRCLGAGHLPTRDHFRASDTHVVSYQDNNYTEHFTGNKADWLICQGQEKIGEGCKDCEGMFWI